MTAPEGPVESPYQEAGGALCGGPLAGPSGGPLEGPLQTHWDPQLGAAAKVVYFFSRMETKTESAVH